MIDLPMEQIGAFLPLIIIILIIFLIIYFIRKKGKGKSIDLGLTIADYKNAKTLNNIFKIILYVLLIIQIIYFIGEIIYINAITQVNLDYDKVEGIEIIQGLLAIPFIIISIIGYIFGGMWIYRMNYNVRCLGATQMRFTPGWSVGWYFIPFINLWKPYQAMKEIYLKTYNLNTKVSQINNTPGFFPFWWTCWIIGGVLTQAEFRLAWRVDSLDGFIGLGYLGIVSSIFVILNWIFFYKIFKYISSMQAYLYNEKNIQQSAT